MGQQWFRRPLFAPTTGTFLNSVRATTNLIVDGTLTASSAVTLSGAITASTNLTVSGTLTGSSNATISGTLTGSSNATINGTLAGSSNVTVAKTLTGSSNATIDGTLAGSSNVTVAKTLTGSSNATIDGTLAGSSNVTVAKTLTGSSNATINGTLTASSNATVAGTLTASSNFAQAAQAVSTGTSTSLVPYGLSTLTCTTTNGGASAFTLVDPPVAGLTKVIFCTLGATSAIASVGTAAAKIAVSLAGGVSGDYSSETILQFNWTGQNAVLYSVSTAKWVLTSSTSNLYNTTH